MSILNYVLADKEKKAELREGYMDFLRHSNTYKIGAGIGNFASDITFDPLPYDEYANKAYEGIQNLYGNTLDEGLARVGDLFDRSPPMMAGGPMSRAGYRHSPLVYEPYTEAEMGSSPYQETDTGPGLMMASGPMARKGYRHHPQGNAPPNAHFETEVNPNADDDYDNLKAMTFHQNQMEPAGTPVKFTSKTFEQEMMDYNNGVPMTRQDFADYNDMRYPPKSDWQKWKESTESGRR